LVVEVQAAVVVQVVFWEAVMVVAPAAIVVESNQQLTSHSKGQKTVGFCSFVAYFNQLFFAS
jgi:hypothetical protein